MTTCVLDSRRVRKSQRVSFINLALYSTSSSTLVYFTTELHPPSDYTSHSYADQLSSTRFLSQLLSSLPETLSETLQLSTTKLIGLWAIPSQ